MFPVCIFPYPAGLFFLMLMIFLLLWLLVHTGVMCGGFNIFFPYFPGRRPAWEFPFPFRRLSSSAGGPRRTEIPPPDYRYASTVPCFILQPHYDGLGTGSARHWRLLLTF